MSANQLNLLDWQGPAELHVFPLDRRIGKIRRVSDLLEVKHGKAAEGYWRTVARGLAEQMERSGLSDAVIHAAVQAFSEAVQLELASRWKGCRNPDGDQAA